MLTDNYDKIIACLVDSRGEEGCEEACKKLKTNFKVDKVKDIPDKHAAKILDSLKGEVNVKNAEEVLDIEESKKCSCGRDVYKRGMFYICNECRKIVT